MLYVCLANPCVGRKNGYKHELGSCNLDYCICFNDKPIFYQCATGQVFVAAFGLCVAEELAPGCAPDVSDPPPTDRMLLLLYM